MKAPTSRRSAPACDVSAGEADDRGDVRLAKDALHIHVGLLILIVAAALLGRRIGDALPLAAVILAALTGELWDILDRHAIGVAPDWSGHWKDMWNTCLWPAAFTLLARTTALFARSGDGGEQPLK